MASSSPRARSSPQVSRIKYSYLIEPEYGFLLLKSQIIPTGKQDQVLIPDRAEGQWGVWLPPPVGSMARARSSPQVSRIKYSYLIELRDSGEYGFLLLKSQIIPTGKQDQVLVPDRAEGQWGVWLPPPQEPDHPNR